MELPLLFRSKDVRLIRPKRVAFLEWLHAWRHNAYCDYTLFADQARLRLLRLSAMLRKHFLSLHLESMGEVWDKHIRPLLNGQTAAERAKHWWAKWGQHGLGSTYILPILFVMGLCLGIGAKLWAEQWITIGYEDYKLAPAHALYDLNALEQNARAKNISGDTDTSRPSYPACTAEDHA